MEPTDRDIIARTIVGEAANQPFEGQQAVANVILNRLRSGKFGGSIADVVFAPSQFEPWQTRRGELEAIKPDSPAYTRALLAIDAAEKGDATGGATHFLEPNIVRQRRGGTLPAWAQGPSTQIGNHLFFSPGGGGPTGSTGPVPVKVASNPAPYNPSAPVANAVPRAPTNLAETIAATYSSQPADLTPLVNQRQIGPFPTSTEGAEPIEDAVFQPRTTKHASRLVRKV